MCCRDNDEENLILRYSPNSNIRGTQTFPRLLSKEGYDVTLTNDMKAAVQDFARFGEGKGHKSICVITFSEGCNFAVVRDFENVSSAEFGHHL